MTSSTTRISINATQPKVAQRPMLLPGVLCDLEWTGSEGSRETSTEGRAGVSASSPGPRAGGGSGAPLPLVIPAFYGTHVQLESRMIDFRHPRIDRRLLPEDP